MGADNAACFINEVVNGAVQPRRGGVRMDVENKYLAGIQARGPEKSTVIREA